MKYAAIGLILLGIGWGVRIYLKILERQLEYLTDWEKIFRLWRELITRFSSSVDELVLKTITESSTADLSAAKAMKDKSIGILCTEIQGSQEISASDKQIVLEVLQGIGSSMVDSELESLSHAISKLQQKIIEREKIVKERRQLIYKLTPLLCGAIVIILW